MHGFRIFVLVIFYFFIYFSCPVGQRRLGATQCIDENECEDPGICQNGGTCINLSDFRHFRCICPNSWSGAHCEELAAPAVVLAGGKDFIIVFVFCVLSLLSKYDRVCEFNLILVEIIYWQFSRWGVKGRWLMIQSFMETKKWGVRKKRIKIFQNCMHIKIWYLNKFIILFLAFIQEFQIFFYFVKASNSLGLTYYDEWRE